MLAVSQHHVSPFLGGIKTAKKNGWKYFAIFVIAALVFGGGGYLLYEKGVFQQSQIDSAEQDATESSAYCPDTKQTTATITLKNLEDDTTDDTFDATGYLYKVNDGVEEYDQSITDTTAGSATLDCLQTYRLYLVSADGDEGDNAKIVKVVSGAGAVVGEGGKYVEFTPSGRSYTLKLGGERHGVLEFKMFDNVNNGWMFDTVDATAGDYEVEGTQFNTTTTGDADLTVGAIDEVDVTLYFRSTKTNTSFDDFGYYILIEAGTDTATVWQKPTLTLNGVQIESVALAGDEARQFQSYDWAFFVPNNDISDAQNTLRINMKPQTSQNPSTDLQWDFAAVGQFLSVDGSSIKQGAARDDTSATVVFAVQDSGLNIA
jgi:hypothetical protein